MNPCTLVELIEQLADSGLPRIPASASIAAAVQMMSMRGVSALLVIREDGLLGGLFSEHEVLTKVVATRRDPHTTPLSLVMNRGVRLVGPEVSVENALEMMIAEQHAYIVVIDGAVIHGLLALRDLAAHVMRPEDTAAPQALQPEPSRAADEQHTGV